jgi:hypothetical protein
MYIKPDGDSNPRSSDAEADVMNTILCSQPRSIWPYLKYYCKISFKYLHKMIILLQNTEET